MHSYNPHKQQQRNFKEDCTRLRLQLLYIDDVCQNGLAMNRLIRDNRLTGAVKKSKPIAEFMVQRKVFFTDEATVPRARLSTEWQDSDGCPRRRSSIIDEQYESPTRDQIKKQWGLNKAIIGFRARERSGSEKLTIEKMATESIKYTNIKEEDINYMMTMKQYLARQSKSFIVRKGLALTPEVAAKTR